VPHARRRARVQDAAGYDRQQTIGV
jgi:hypothetical protein